MNRNLANRSPTVLDRAAIDESPLIRVEATEFRLDFEKRLGVLDRRFNLSRLRTIHALASSAAIFRLL